MNRLLEYFTRLLAVWVIAAAVAAYFFPGAFVHLKPYTDWLFALTMLGIGAVLNVEDFKPIFTQPHITVLGTAAQFIIMPLLGFVIAKLLKLPPALALGVILVGAVPGAMASTVISYLAKADVAYSVALTTTTTFLAPVLTPAFTYLYGRTFIPIPFWPMLLSILKIVILPVLIGFGLKYYFKERVDKFSKVFPALSTLFIAFICGLVVALNKDYIAEVSLVIFAAVFLHNMFGLIFGYWFGIFYRFNLKRRRTLAFEVGMQNAGLGAVLALKHFSAQAALPNALFAVWCIITASVIAEFWQRNCPDPHVRKKSVGG